MSKTRITELHKDESGIGYAMILLLLVLLGSMSLAFLAKVGTDISANMNRGKNMQAHYLAESAANHALWRLLNEPAFPASETKYYLHSLGQGRYGYKVRRHTGTTFATIATVGAIGESEVYQSYVLHIKPPSGLSPASACPKNLLFVVDDSLNLTSKETTRKALMESWNSNVTLLDDSAPESEYDTAIAANDVVCVSPSAVDASILDKLTGKDIGIVDEVIGLLDNFGFCNTTTGSISSDTFTTSDPVHYITSPYSGNAVNVFTLSLSMAVMGGTLAPDLQNLGEVTGTPSLVALDTGGQRWDGSPAPNRRVFLPFTNAETNQLTTDGENLMMWAVEWAANMDGGCGGTPLLYVVKDSGILTTDETDKKTLIEGWGYIVTLIDDDDTQANFDSAVAANNVVYVSGEVSDTLLGTKLKSTTLGLVNEQITLHDEFGFSSGFSTKAFDNIFIEDNMHDITTGFSMGTFNIATSDQLLQGLSGTLAPGLQTLATTWINGPNYKDGLALLDTGADLYGGGTAAGKRVQLPWGGSGFDFSALNDNGKTIMHRAIEWTASGGGSPPTGPTYVEAFQTINATQADSWHVIDLSSMGVPADAVVEVAITNSNVSAERWGGIRAVGSSLDRRYLLHEAEGGGLDMVVMHVQADSSSQIECYADTTSNVEFTMLGYWTGTNYVELFESFKAGANNSWQDKSLNSYGVGADEVCEIVMTNSSASSEYESGVRTDGSSVVRKVDIHEAEAGGVDAASMFVKAGSDANATIEVFAESNTSIDFYLVGYWSTSPGTYTEAFSTLSPGVTSSSTWEDRDISSYGVPADAVAQIALSNMQNTTQDELGIREKGSSLQRTADIMEAEDFGEELISIHVNVDESSLIQWYDANIGMNHKFHLLGWWVLSGP